MLIIQAEIKILIINFSKKCIFILLIIEMLYNNFYLFCQLQMLSNVNTQQNQLKKNTPMNKLIKTLTKIYQEIISLERYKQFFVCLQNFQNDQIQSNIQIKEQQRISNEAEVFVNSSQNNQLPSQRIMNIVQKAISNIKNEKHLDEFIENLSNFSQDQTQQNNQKLLQVQKQPQLSPTQKINTIIQTVLKNFEDQSNLLDFLQNLQKINQHSQDQQLSKQRQNQQILVLNQLKKNQNNKMIQNQNQFMEDTENFNKLQEAKQFCSNLQVQFTSKLSAFDKTNPIYKNFFQTLRAFFQQKNHVFIKQAFKAIKNCYNYDTISEKNQRISNKSFKKGQNEESFNLELTIKSRNSKNFMYQSRQDSLVYSNATSFGLQSTQNKPLNFKGRLSSSQKQKRSSGTQKDINIANIDKASSKGSIQKDSSVKSLSDNEKPIKLRQKAISTNVQKKYFKIQNEEQKKININNFIQKEGQEDDNRQRVHTQSRSSRNVIMAHKKMSHKIIRADNYSQKSVFQSQIQTYQSKIAKIKQAKLLKKKKLQEQLAKINQQIISLKKQQQMENSPQNEKKSPNNTFQSRLKINNDQTSLKKAQHLVKNLRSQKQNRIKAKIQQPFDQNIHQHMQEIMKMRYLNEQKIKQKKQLEVIQRMKKQYMRKIIQQKQKQASNEFLAKLKKSENHPEIIRNSGNIGQLQQLKNSKIKKISQQKNRRTPTKKTQVFQQIEGLTQTPELTKKKAYLNKIRHFAIIKKSKPDLYEQILN